MWGVSLPSGVDRMLARSFVQRLDDTYRIGGKIAQRLFSIDIWVHCRLIQCGTRQGHEWHLSRL